MHPEPPPTTYSGCLLASRILRASSSVALPDSVVQAPRKIISQLQYYFLQPCHHPVRYLQLPCHAVPPISFTMSCFLIPSSRALLHITVPILCFLGVTTGLPTQNFTIEVPNGTTNHGDPESLCVPSTSIDIASFLLFNYVAHGATVVSYPGEPALNMLFHAVIAILSPTYGVIRAFNFIIRLPLLTAKNDLEVAARSGALCMLVRSSSWKPQKGDNIRNALIEDPSTNVLPGYVPMYSYSRPIKLTNVFFSYQRTASLSIYKPPWLNDMTRFWSYTDTSPVQAESRIGLRDVFGLSKLPASAQPEYEFAFVPRNTKVLGLVDSTPSSSISDNTPLRSPNPLESSVSTPKLSSSSNLARGTVALLQLLYTSFTIYHTNGDQVNQYGFAAPGLTVLPYAVMSGLNLLASLVAPHYPKLYLVRSEVMEEAERRTGLRFHYVVGRVVDESCTDSDNIANEGWSEIAGSFEDDNKVLHVIHSEKKIEMSDRSSQRIYVPACPRFQRTDDTRASPLRRPSFFSFSRNYIRLPQRPQHSEHAYSGLNAYEVYLIVFISGAEFIIMLALSNFSGQQSTLGQRVWIFTWIFAGSLFVAMLQPIHAIIRAHSDSGGWLSYLLIYALPVYFLSYGLPAIGGFVVVSQMLKAYGICYKFV